MSQPWEALANDPEIKPLLVKEIDGREVSRTYLRHAERVSEAYEVDALDRKLADPVERRFLQNPGKLRAQNDIRKRNLLAQSPPTDLTASQRDKLARLEVATRAFASENMPTAEQMRHNPPGAVDHHIAWDRHAKRAVLTWKNVRILQHPQSDAVDLANFERYRPANPSTRTLYTDAQIPGVFGLSPQARENFDTIDWSDPGAFAKEAERRGYTLKVSGAPAQGRAPKPDKAPSPITATCAACGVSYRGGFGPANLRRHTAQAHGMREEVSA